MKHIAVVLALAWMVACNGGEAEPPAPPEPAPAPTPAPTPVPAPTADPCASVPEGDLRGDVMAGQADYQLYCAPCHGPEGRGDGPAALADPKPADHSDPEYMATLSDKQVYCVIQNGGVALGKSPLMVGWGSVLNEEQLRDVLAFVRSLSGT